MRYLTVKDLDSINKCLTGDKKYGNNKENASYYHLCDNDSWDLTPIDYSSALNIKNKLCQMPVECPNEELTNKLIALGVKARMKQELEQTSLENISDVPGFIYAF